MIPIRVIKIGGSLLRRDNLLTDLRCWQASLTVPLVNVWITGGGELVDAIRTRAETQSLSDANAHWSSIEAMDVNAMWLASRIPEWQITNDPQDITRAAGLITSSERLVTHRRLSFSERSFTSAKRKATISGRSMFAADTQAPQQHEAQRAATDSQCLTQNFILQTKSWLIAADHDSELRRRLPYSWDVTSDSIAAWVAIKLRATQLVLLKSCGIPRVSVTELAGLGIVDAYLPTLNPSLKISRFVCQRLPHSSS